LIGFYGEYDNDSITYLGAYTASIEHINYYMRRPYIFLYKQSLKNKEVLKSCGDELKIVRLSDGKIQKEKKICFEEPTV